MKYFFLKLIFFVVFPSLLGGELFRADFDSNFQPKKSVDGSMITWHGCPRMVKDGGMKPGEQSLLLGPGCYGRISLKNLKQQQGMIAFWFRPAESAEQGSHTFLSARWNQKDTYMVLTQGWWETAGTGHIGGKTMFIFNNYFCPGGIDEGTAELPGWSYYAIGWKILPDRRIKSVFYHNGNYQESTGRHALPDGDCLFSDLFLGSDQGTGSQAAKRYANGYFQNFVIYDAPLSRSELDCQVRERIAPRRLEELKWSWRQDAAGMKTADRRDQQGHLLESRVVFIEGWAKQFAEPGRLAAEMKRIKSSGYNVVMPCVWWGSADYDTVPELQSKNFTKVRKKYPGRVIFKEFVAEAHRQGLEVHSSFAVAFSLAVAEGWRKYLTPDGKWMNVYDPAFRKAVVREMVNHVKAFGVDGINLDYVRTNGNGLDSDIARSEYERLYERDFSTDRANAGRMNAYTGRCIGDIIFQTQEQLRKLCPNIVITAAAKPQLKNLGFAPDGRNSALWLDAGWVDVVYCMDYTLIPSTVFLDRCRRETDGPEGLVEGLGNYEIVTLSSGRRRSRLIADGTPVQQLMYCQRKYRNGNGVFTYFWNVIDDKHIEELRQGPFREPARPFWIRRSVKKSLNEVFSLQ